MWKALKRLWSSGESNDAPSEHSYDESNAEQSEPQPAETAPMPPPDPLQAQLRDYDALAQRSPEAAPSHLRTLMLDFPHESRVLRRAAASMESLASDESSELLELAQHFHKAATQAGTEALLRLSEHFAELNDIELATAFATGAYTRERQQGQDGLEPLLVRAMLLARQGAHEDALELLEPVLLPHKPRSSDSKSPFGTPESEEEQQKRESLLLGARVRYAISALLLGEMERLEWLNGDWGEAEGWLSEIAERVRHFPDMTFRSPATPVTPVAAPQISRDEDDEEEAELAPEPTPAPLPIEEEEPPSEGDLSQRLLFLLYGSVLLDHAEEPRLSPAQIHRWMHALAAVVRQTMPPNTRPVWVSPRGEVLARWLGNLLPEGTALPMSARLPRQPIIVMLADDADLATLYEAGPYHDPFPIFQAIKDPTSSGSPMADLIGVFSDQAWLPFEALEAVRTADRLTARVLSSSLQNLAESEGAINSEDMHGFLGWFKDRRPFLELSEGRHFHTRIALDPARPPRV